jgi:hypothetical protein
LQNRPESRFPNGRTNTERGCRIGLADYQCRIVASTGRTGSAIENAELSRRTDERTDVVNLYIRLDRHVLKDGLSL